MIQKGGSSMPLQLRLYWYWIISFYQAYCCQKRRGRRCVMQGLWKRKREQLHLSRLLQGEHSHHPFARCWRVYPSFQQRIHQSKEHSINKAKGRRVMNQAQRQYALIRHLAEIRYQKILLHHHHRLVLRRASHSLKHHSLHFWASRGRRLWIWVASLRWQRAGLHHRDYDWGNFLVITMCWVRWNQVPNPQKKMKTWKETKL